MEEKRFSDLLVQLSERMERVTLKANNVSLQKLDTHEHDDHDDKHAN